MKPDSQAGFDLRKWLADRPDASAAEVADAIARDQDRGWRRGDRPLVESYLPLHPSLADPTAQADLIYAELLLRESFGEAPPCSEYCGRFPHLADRVERLFKLHEAMTGPRAAPPARLQGAVEESPRPSSKIGLQLPGFELLAELGRGGMGVVYKARQVDLGRIVAVKVLRGDGFDLGWIERLRREAAALARVQHPNIVQVFDVGMEGERSYLVLEYLAGGTLADRLRQGPLPPREAAAIIRVVAEAVQAAHEASLVHRDLKPANVLFTRSDPLVLEPSLPHDSSSISRSDSVRLTPAQTIKVADFGLVKQLDQTSLSLSGETIGTPSYMAPEQASGGKNVGPAADIYALGAILYECLAGRPPFIGDSPLSILLLVTGSEPIQPSRLRPGIPRDLEAVCLKCLDKSPGRRYASAQDLADDLGNYLAGQPTVARPLSLVGRAFKLVRRHPLTTGLLATIAASLVLGMLGVLWQWREAIAARTKETAQRTLAEQLLYAGMLARAELLWESGDVAQARLVLDECKPAAGMPDFRGCEWYYLYRAIRPEYRVDTLPQWVNAMVPRGARAEDLVLAVGRPRYTITQEVQADDGFSYFATPLAPPRPGPTMPGSATSVACHPSRGWMAWGTTNRKVVVAEADGTIRHTIDVGRHVTHLAFATEPDGLLAGCIDPDARLLVIDPEAGRVTQELPSKVGKSLALSVAPSGKRIALAGVTGVVRCLSWPELTTVSELSLKPNQLASVTWSPDGESLACGSADGLLYILDDSLSRVTHQWPAHSGPIYAIAWAADGSLLYTGGSDRVIKSWHVATQRPVHVWRGHEQAIRCLAVDPAGQWLASGAQDKSLRWWNLNDDGRGRRLTFHNRLNDLHVTNDAIAAVSLEGHAARWDLATGQRDVWTVLPLRGRPTYPARYTGCLTGGRHVVGIDKSAPGTLRIWDVADQSCVKSWSHDGRVHAVWVDPAGQNVAWTVYLEDATEIHRWDHQTQTLAPPIRLNRIGTRMICISPTGKHIVLTTSTDLFNRQARTLLYTVATGELREIARGSVLYNIPAFSPDGENLAMVVDGALKCVRLSDFRILFQFTAERTTTQLAYSPDGSRLALVGYDGVVTLIDPIARRKLFQLRGLSSTRPEDMAVDARVAFTPDGGRVVSTNWDGSINIFDLRPVVE